MMKALVQRPDREGISRTKVEAIASVVASLVIIFWPDLPVAEHELAKLIAGLFGLAGLGRWFMRDAIRS